MEIAWLLAALFSLLVIATPIITIALMVKFGKLRAELDHLKSETASQRGTFQRELADLKRQIAAAILLPTQIPPEKLAEQTTATRATISVTPQEVHAQLSRSEAPASIKFPPPVIIPELITATQQETKPVQSSPIPPPPPPFPLAVKLPQTPAAPSAQTETKPAVSPPATPRELPTVQPPAVKTPAPPPPSTSGVPSVVAARVTSAPSLSALRVPAPKPTFQQRMNTVSAIEETLGTNWLLKIGIIIFVVGVALFGIYELGAFGPLGKVGISCFSSVFLLVGGLYLEKQERYRLLGFGGIGGGWALLFFSTFGIYHVEAMRVLPLNTAALTLDCALMLLIAGAMAIHTLRYRSQFVTGLAFLLGYTTVALSQDTVYSLSAGVFLAVGLVSIVLKMGWFELEVFGILSTYLNHLYWLYRLLGINGAHGHAFPQYHASLTMLFCYWLIFRISYVARKPKSVFEEHVSSVAAILNITLLLGCMKFQSVQPQLAYIALLVVGAVEFLCAQIPSAKRRREAFVILTVAGSALMLAAAPAHYAYPASDVAILWLVAAEVFLIAGVLVKEVVFCRLGLLVGLLVGLHLVAIDFRGLVNVRLESETIVLASGVLFALCAVVFYLNAAAGGSRWKEFFEVSPERPLLTVHTYLGAFAAVSAAWALFAHDGTALAFAAAMLVLAALGRVLDSPHIQVQYTVLGFLTLYRAVIVNLHSESPAHVHLNSRLLTLPILGAVFYLTAKLAVLRDDSAQRALRGFFAAAGTGLFALLIWFEVPELWQPTAFITFAIILSEAAQPLRDRALVWHSHILSGLAVLAALTADPGGIEKWHTIPLHALGALPVFAASYWLAKRFGTDDDRHLRLARGAYTWLAAGLAVWILEETLRTPWIAVGWILFAVALVLSARWIRYQQLAWQANVVGLCALLRAFFYNYDLGQKFWGPITLRVFTISLVAAGLYFLCRKAAPEDRFARPVAFLQSFAATGLLALLAWYEAPNGWLAPLWAAFALVLAIIDQRFDLEELPWQAHILAGLTLIRSVTVNLYVTANWHGLSVRLLSLAIVAVVLYALSRLIRMPEEWRQLDFHHIYSWTASTIVSLLLWYELQSQPTSIAVAWGAFGLVLFEYGLLRKITKFRYQAYIALIAAFTRIFFANLTVGEPGEFWGPRMYTILPLILIFFFVYAQLPQKEEDLARDRRLHFDLILAYLGTGSLAALFYFQFPIEWVITAWAALVFVLLGAAVLLDRSLFLYQGLLLTVGIFARGMAHNLFGGSYFGAGNWSGRYLVLSSAAAILLASLFFAFQLRDRFKPFAGSGRISSILQAVVRRPEQLQFFVPISLITCMLALKSKSGMVTVSWGIEGVLIFLLALALKERSFRLTGLGLLLLCVAKVMAMDVWGLQPRDRYITFIIVGAALVFVSFLYSRYRDTIRQFL